MTVSEIVVSVTEFVVSRPAVGATGAVSAVTWSTLLVLPASSVSTGNSALVIQLPEQRHTRGQRQRRREEQGNGRWGERYWQTKTGVNNCTGNG